MKNDWGMAYINLIYCSICPAVSSNQKERRKIKVKEKDDKGTCLLRSEAANKNNLRRDIKGALFLPYRQLSAFVVTHWFGLKPQKIKHGIKPLINVDNWLCVWYGHVNQIEKRLGMEWLRWIWMDMMLSTTAVRKDWFRLCINSTGGEHLPVHFTFHLDDTN